jgi:hypothetical protein
MTGVKESGGNRPSLKSKIVGSVIGGLVFTFAVTWLLMGMILTPFEIEMGGLPIPFWFGGETVNWVWFVADWIFWIPIVYLLDYCFIGEEGTRMGCFLQNR